MFKTQFHVAAMDCPSEEQLIRSVLANPSLAHNLEVDIGKRTVTVWHNGSAEPLRTKMDELGLGASLVESVEVPDEDVPLGKVLDQSRVLRVVLVINVLMFAIELVAGWLAQSAGLLADSLDMLADAGVYGIALWAVARNDGSQRAAARVSGWLQLALALGVLIEVARRIAMGSSPEPPAIVAVAALALAANVFCMLALSRHRDGGVHMQASWIFTSNDVIANVGVIVAGVLVSLTGSATPDLVIGAVIGAIVLRGALKILKLSRPQENATPS